ncbi:MAG: YgiT-type zinc finger protein [Nitrospira sp.]|nr:MAG: YgiT-type zinc finger protein [Nitrospira sp.]
MYDYGKCHVCGGKMESKRISLDLRIRKRLLIVERVPAGVCSQCGEKVVNASVGRQLATLVAGAGKKRPTKKTTVPVIAFTADVA